jgi:hypothetical protein
MNKNPILVVPDFTNGVYKVATLKDETKAQDNKEDCENTELRDCNWALSGNKIRNESGTFDAYVCVPKFTPGFDLTSGNESEDICNVAEQTCTVKFEKGGINALTGTGEWHCKENCECCSNSDGDYTGCSGEKQGYHEAFCEALGDCGTKKNYIGVEGWNSKNPMIIKP